MCGAGLAKSRQVKHLTKVCGKLDHCRLLWPHPTDSFQQQLPRQLGRSQPGECRHTQKKSSAC